MVLTCISLWLLLSICQNMSGHLIGIHGLRFLLLSVLIFSPVVSWLCLYNLLMISIHKSSLLYLLKYPFIQLYSYSLSLSLGVSISEMIVCILLCLVSFLINIYILKYLYKDKTIIRFLSMMMLFTFNMMLLILAQDTITLFIGWEMIGITSLLLIGYYNNRPESSRAGLKAILYNRLGDIFFMLFILIGLSVFNTNTMSLYCLLCSYQYYSTIYNHKLFLLLGMSIILSAWSKSTQLGFQPWLLDAMEGPTPVSALLHSATLVTAGVVLLYKFSYIFYLSSSLLILLILLSSISCILNSFSSISYIDVKRIVAYSTATHISLMILCISLDLIGNASNIREVSILHLFYHGWSKSLIFILCGYLISIFHTQDLRLFGNIYLQLPLLFSLVNLSLLSIFGFPGSSISSSKDIILEFGLLSVYGSTLLIPMFVILLLSQGYSLGLLLYLLYNSSYHSTLHSLFVYYKNSFLASYSYYATFFTLILCVIYLPALLHDILLYTNIHVSHHIIRVDVFSLLSLVGLLLSYYHCTFNSSISITSYFSISNNRLFFDKLWSSIVSIASVVVLYTTTFVLEYGWVMSYAQIINLILLILLI